MNIYHFTPYSLEKDLAKEINKYVELVPESNDWIVVYDGDVIWTQPDWGHRIKNMIEANLDFDLLTVLATRIGVKAQRLNRIINANADMINLHNLIEKQFNSIESYKAKRVKTVLGGYLLCFRKKLALEIPFISSDSGMLGVDGRWTKKLIEHNKKIGICEKLAIIHWYRLNKKSVKDTTHLLDHIENYLTSKIDIKLVIPPLFKGLFPNEKELVIELKAGVPKKLPGYIVRYYSSNRPSVFSPSKKGVHHENFN